MLLQLTGLQTQSRCAHASHSAIAHARRQTIGCLGWVAPPLQCVERASGAPAHHQPPSDPLLTEKPVCAQNIIHATRHECPGTTYGSPAAFNKRCQLTDAGGVGAASVDSIQHSYLPEHLSPYQFTLVANQVKIRSSV